MEFVQFFKHIFPEKWVSYPKKRQNFLGSGENSHFEKDNQQTRLIRK
jgi:hypothetical protein